MPKFQVQFTRLVKNYDEATVIIEAENQAKAEGAAYAMNDSEIEKLKVSYTEASKENDQIDDWQVEAIEKLDSPKEDRWVIVTLGADGSILFWHAGSQEWLSDSTKASLYSDDEAKATELPFTGKWLNLSVFDPDTVNMVGDMKDGKIVVLKDEPSQPAANPKLYRMVKESQNGTPYYRFGHGWSRGDFTIFDEITKGLIELPVGARWEDLPSEYGPDVIRAVG